MDEAWSDERLPGQPPSGHTIRSEREALWVCAMIESMQATVDRRLEAFADEIDECAAYIAQEQRRIEQLKAEWEPRLQAYLEQEQALGRLGEQKSIPLPGGRRLRLRWAEAKIEPSDKAAYEAWGR